MKFQGMKRHKNYGQVPDFGAIFMSDRRTKEECLERKLFGLPYVDLDFVMKVKAGMILFLFEYTKRELYGVFQATSNGRMNIVPDAYSSSGKKFPAQVRFSTIWECHRPLSELDFCKAIGDNYFSSFKFNFGLSRDQVRRLLWLFDSRRAGALKQGLSFGDPVTTHKQPESNVLGLQCSSTSAANYNSSSVSEFSGHLSASGSTKAASLEEPKNWKTDLGDIIPLSSAQEDPKNGESDLGDYIPLSSSEEDQADLGDFIPLSSSSDSDSPSSPDRDLCSGIVELSGVSSQSNVGLCCFKEVSESQDMVDTHQHSSASDDYLGVKGLYSDIPTKDSNVFSRLNIHRKESPQVQENRMKIREAMLEVMEDLQQKHIPSKQIPHVRENRTKVDESVFEIMEDLQQRREKWRRVGRRAKPFERKSRDLTVRKKSVFSRLNVASKHDFEVPRPFHGGREELGPYRSSSRPCPGSQEELRKYGYGAGRPFAGLRAEYQTYGSKVDRPFPGLVEEFQQYGFKGERPIRGLRQESQGRHMKRKAHPYKKENEVCLAKRRNTVFSRLSWVSETQLPTSDPRDVKWSVNQNFIRNCDNEENFDYAARMKISKFPHTSKETNSWDTWSSRGIAEIMNSWDTWSSRGIAGEMNSRDTGSSRGIVGEMNSWDTWNCRGIAREMNSWDTWSSRGIAGEMNSWDTWSSRGIAGEISGWSPKLKSELLKTECKLEKSGCITGAHNLNEDHHKKRRVDPLLSKKPSDAESVDSDNRLNILVPSLEFPANDDIHLSQKGQASPSTCPLGCKRNHGEMMENTTGCESKLGGPVANTFCGDVTNRKILKTYRRRGSSASPTVQDCNQKMAVEEENATRSEPSIKADKVGVPTKNPSFSCENKTCNEKKSAEKGNADCSEPSTETDGSVESGEVLPDKEGAQTENPSINSENDEQMVGPEEGKNIVNGNAESADHPTESDAALESGELLPYKAGVQNSTTETDVGMDSSELLVSAQTENPPIISENENLVQVAGVDERNAECFEPSTKTDASAAESDELLPPKAENPSCSSGNENSAG